ncbi:MAG: RagB/SusD family nutrient uptake outer membrane protein [Prevotella sp.]|nr:RagB/SusD family nutrient uptake outer membrane protein [Prevotella sp.]
MKTINIYNKVKARVSYLLLLSFSPLLLSSCSDFLDILPMNSTVLENYWKEKADVTGAVNGCYEALASEDVVTRMGVWGELRSDNVVAGANVPNHLNEMLRENLLPTNDMCKWSYLYNVINRCNIVCHYAPEVEQIDPNYTYNEMKATIAEMKAIRALCYFYLIRTFRDVPYTTEPSIDDNQNYVIPATRFDVVIDSLITDLESVKDDAQRRFELEKVQNKSIYVPSANNSRITRWAIYALLADLYLWKGDWNNVIKYCDMVIDYKKQVYEELLQIDQINDIELYDGIPMIMEATVKGTKDVGNTYTSLFGSGNSFESIFEIYYNGNTGQENNWISSYYGNRDNSIGRLRAADFLMDGFTSNNNQVWLSQGDCRAYESMESSGNSLSITKYVRQSASFSLQRLGIVNVAGDRRTRKDANWIIYRLSDVMLMKAEALIQRSENDWPEAFQLINNVYKRANNISPETTTGSLVFETYNTSKEKMEDLLFEERHREFLFEGKRWFDLVRLARRDGKTERLTSSVIRKHRQDQNVIRIKLTDPNYIYFPYAKAELKANPLLIQNPAFSNTEEGVLK